VPLNSGAEAMATAMLAGLKEPELPGPLPAWLWRQQSEQSWQLLLNRCLHQNNHQL